MNLDVRLQKVRSHVTTLNTACLSAVVTAHRNRFGVVLIEQIPVHGEDVKQLQRIFLENMLMKICQRSSLNPLLLLYVRMHLIENQYNTLFQILYSVKGVNVK
jgi:hypothetical protein